MKKRMMKERTGMKNSRMFWWMGPLAYFAGSPLTLGFASLTLSDRSFSLKLDLSPRSRSWMTTWPFRWLGFFVTFVLSCVLGNVNLPLLCTLNWHLSVKWPCMAFMSVGYCCCIGVLIFSCCSSLCLGCLFSVACVFVFLLATRFSGLSCFHDT